jgi:DNA repair protein RecO (recombination protein O)
MTQPRTLRVEAVVLRHMEMGEADRLLTVFSREQGKLRCIAKGVRKIRSRKAGHLQPFSMVKLMLARGRDLWIITQAELIDAFQPLQADLTLVGYASYVIELVDRFTFDEDANPSLYRLMTQTLKRLTEAEHPEMVLRYYDIRLLDLMGFRPQLFHCISCEKEIVAEDQYFSASLGGVLCPHCGYERSHARGISLVTLKYMRHFQRSAFQAAMQAPYRAGVLREMDDVLNDYLQYVLERRLNSPVFIRKVSDS